MGMRNLSVLLAVFGHVAFGEPDLFVGTGGLGHVSPAATMPFGAVQPGPDTTAKADGYGFNWEHTCGYQFGDGYVWRFSQTHLFGTGCLGLGNIAILPFVGSPTGGVYSAEMDKSTERAEPGFYGVTFRNGISCEMTAARQVSRYRFTYPKGCAARLLLDLDWAISWTPEKSDGSNPSVRFVKVSEVAFPSDREAVGRQDVFAWCETDFRFALETSAPMTGRRCVREAKDGRGTVWELDFGTIPDGVLEVKIAVVPGSSGSAAAIRAVRGETRSFAAARQAAADAWSEMLGRVEIDPSTDPKVAASFRAALYRTMLQPNEYGGEWGYSTFSLWDTFRAAHPLYTIVCPERVPGFVDALVRQHGRQGFLPIWALAGRENYCMIGHHAVPVIADAYLKGLKVSGSRFQVSGEVEFWERAYEAVKDSLTRSHTNDSLATWGLLKEDWDVLDRYGYLPYDKLSGSFRGKKVTGESVSRLLECAYDDACAARFAAALGKAEDAAFFARRAGCWTNVFDRTLGCVRGRDSKGRWREPFDMFNCSHGPWSDSDFTEGNAWQYTWHVLHDPERLFELLGGRDAALRRLDALFDTEREARGEGKGDVTGLIGQYAHGNEPSHHVIYLYTLLGRPDRTAELVREVFDRLYAPSPDGLCGNDDCGQMAAWYVFSALGFYPVDPCGGEYVIGAPQVPGAQVKVSGAIEAEGRNSRSEANGLREQRNSFTVVARGLSKENKYVKSVKLNGKPVTDGKIRHADILRGGTLEFEMTREKEVR